MSEHVVPTRVYYTIFAVLMLCTGLTVGIAFVDLGAFNIVVALVIAAFKAALVILFFMHVKYSTRMIPIVLACGVFWLLVLLAITFADYFTRGWLGVPGR